MTTATMIEKDIIITRVFDAPRERVWKAWTDPEHFMRWWGPQGFTAPYCTIDLRPGGSYLNCMRGPGPDGVVRDYWSTGVYQEIVPMERIVYSDSFSDEKGRVVPASFYGMPGEWPMTMTVTVEFQEHSGKTEMRLLHEGIPRSMRDDCIAGWNSSFDKLAASLK